MPFEDLVHIDDCCFPPLPPLKKDARKRVEAVRDLETKEDDVLLITFPKCGTHWVWEIIVMLLKGEAEYHPLVREHVFLEVADLSNLDSLPSPKVINSHLPFKWLPQEHFRSGRKAVNVIRNPKDAAVSLYYKNVFGGYLDFQKELYRAVKSNPEFSLYTMYYETLKKDPESEILRLAGYLEVTCSRELAVAIADKCSFQNMKHASLNVKDHGEIAKIMKKMGGGRPPNFYRKGEVGDWKNWYTVSQSERHDAMIKEELKGIDFDLRLIYENTQ